LNANIIPFGKYRGQMIENVAEADPQYVDWLSKQDWMRSKCPTLYQVIINNFCEPSETPEHNEIQAKFLDKDFRDAVGKTVFEWFHRWTPQRRNGMNQRKEFEGSRKSVQLENDGADVAFLISIREFNSFEFSLWCVKSDAYYLRDDEEEMKKRAEKELKENPSWIEKKSVRVEIKPSIGDDYPAVLRQMQRSKCQILFVRNYSGIGIDEKTFVELFRSQNILVIFERDVVLSQVVPSSIPSFSDQLGTTLIDDL